MKAERIAEIRAIVAAHPGHRSSGLLSECLDEIELLQARKARRKPVAEPLLPPSVFEMLPREFRDSDEFCSAWAEFCEMRASMRSPLTEGAVRRFALSFKEWGPAGSAAAIGESIKSRWVGIFQPKRSPLSGKRDGVLVL